MLRSTHNHKSDGNGRSDTANSSSKQFQTDIVMLENEGRLRSMLNNMLEGIQLIGHDWRYIFVNDVAAKHGQSTKEKLIGNTMMEMYPGIETTPVFKALECCMTKREPQRMENKFMFPDGNTGWFDLSIQPVPEGIFVLSTDITSHKLAEEALRQSEEKYRALIENSQDGILIIQNEKIKFANQAIAAMLGYTVTEAIGANFRMFVAPEDITAVVERYVNIPDDRLPSADFEMRLLHKDAVTRIWVNINAGPLLYNGKTARMATVKNIDERKRAEENMRLLAAAVEQSSAAIAIIDTSAIMRYVNSAFETMTEYSREDLIGKSAWNLKSEKHDDPFYENIWDAISSGKIWSGKLTSKTKSGRFFHSEVNICPVFDSSGKICNYVVSQEDITQRLSLEQQLRQAQKMEVIGRLAGGIAHDFNNILTVITGYGEILLSKAENQPAMLPDLREIKKATERASGLTRQLLAFSRNQVMEPQLLNINSVVKEMEKMSRRIIGEDISLVISLSGNTGNIVADKGKIEQVLMNLTVNAKDAMPNGGVLTIETYPDFLSEEEGKRLGIGGGHYIVLSVSDTGIGMDEQTLSRIFEPFFTTKTQEKGTGLGLSTVHGIVYQSGGGIDVESKPGHGTRFKVYLPEDKSNAAGRIITKVEPKISAGAETILVAEDDEIIGKLIFRVLTESGYTVLVAKDPYEALEICENQSDRVDLLLTDMVMPGMNGRVLAERITARHPAIKVVWMSGYTDNEIISPEELSGMIFLQKPFNKDELLRKIRMALDSNPQPDGNEKKMVPSRK